MVDSLSLFYHSRIGIRLHKEKTQQVAGRTSQDVLVRVDRLSRFFGGKLAVDRLSFELHRGEVLGFLGPNGAGKSTTMRLISGNLAPTGGRIRIAGYDLLDQPREAKAQIGYLPEQPPLYRDLTVDEYLVYVARLNGIAVPAWRVEIERVKQRCGLSDAGPRLVGNLSKGYQQRVGIAQAIVHQPSVVILDEPTVGLDPLQIRDIRALIREISREHGVILSTHILPEAQAVCDRVQIIHRGRMVMDDSVAGFHSHSMTGLIVGFATPPAIAVLQECLPGTDWQVLGNGRFRIHGKSLQRVAQRLAPLAVANGWGLLELQPEYLSLEQVFIELICRDDPASVVPAGTAG